MARALTAPFGEGIFCAAFQVAWCPVQLRSPYLGLQQDVFVSPSQRLVVGGSEVEYLFGCENVALVAQDLLGGSVALRAEGGQSVP